MTKCKCKCNNNGIHPGVNQTEPVKGLSTHRCLCVTNYICYSELITLCMTLKNHSPLSFCSAHVVRNHIRHDGLSPSAYCAVLLLCVIVNERERGHICK